MPENIVYEITNPHDACTIEHHDPITAALAVLVLGRGAYGLRRVSDGAPILPVFAFAESPEVAMEAWGLQRGITDISAEISRRYLPIADALESLVYGAPSQREYTLRSIRVPGMTGGDFLAALATHNEAQRSSITNIGKIARMLASGYRSGEIKGKAEAEPR